VGASTENPPQTHITIVPPQYGILEIKLVITVAPQKDICPQGSTYPIKEIIIIKKNKNTPTIHVVSWKKVKKNFE